MTQIICKGARFDGDDFRTALWRVWDWSKPPLIFVMLNPSTAGELEEDPTSRRTISFAQGFGFGGVGILNLSDFRSTDPKKLKAQHFRSENNIRLDELLCAVAAFGGAIICGYGAHPIALDNADWFKARARHRGVPLHCLGRTKDGHPRHPLYVRGDQPLELFQ